MFQDTRAGGSAGWMVVAGGLLGSGLAALACGGLSFDLFLADRWEEWFPPPDPLADLISTDASGIDWLAVHRELLPLWVLGVARGEHPPELLDRLRAGVAADAELSAILTDLETGLVTGEGARAEAAVAAWNRRLDALGVPFFVDAAGRGNGVYVKAYRALWDGRGRVGDHAPRVRLLTRVDNLNVVEGYLGQVTDPDNGALIVVDRVAEHAADALWPLLDPDSLDPAAGPVAAELKAALSPDAFAALAETAAARARFLATVEEIRERRDCSNYVVQTTPALGFDAEVLERVSEVAWRDRGKSCPAVKPSEASALEETTDALRDRDDLPAALEALLAVALRPTVLHESRHVADALVHGTIAEVPCPGCPEELGWSSASGELSAYLSSFASDGLASCAWLQACSATRRIHGAHATAFAAIAGMVSSEPCDAAIPDDLVPRSRDLEIDWLMREDRVELPADLPARVRWPTDVL